MRKGIAAFLSILVCFQGVAWAAPSCERPQDAMAVHVAAIQQQMMVAALVCHDVQAYNGFVLSHQSALQASDRTLQAFFLTANLQTGFDDYNAFKTERANAFSLRSLHDPQFCDQVNANFMAAEGRPLEAVVAEQPYPAETGAIQCDMPALGAPTTEAELTRR